MWRVSRADLCGFRGNGVPQGVILQLLSRLGHATLNCTSQRFLPVQLHNRIIARLTYRSVPCDFAGFNSAPAFLLPHCDVRAAE